MGNGSGSNSSGLSHLVAAFGGFLFATFAARELLADFKKSRAERDSPDEAKEAFDEISLLLDVWETDPENDSEDDYVRDLAAYLESCSDWEVEIFPNSPEGKPDILIGDLIALEIKVNPSKNEINRCVGQCAGYSRLWITWMVIVNSKASKVGRLRELLEDKGLEHILVFDFS